MLEQASDMQQRRFAGARGRYQRHRLPTPQGEFDAIEHVDCLVALAVMPLDIVQEQDRDFLFPLLLALLLLLHLHLDGGIRLTHSAAPPPDRGAPHAMTDRASQAAKA